MIRVIEIKDQSGLDRAFAIREAVFVDEQKVPREEEYDEYEVSARHYLAFWNEKPCGAARWRQTENGVKLERFAVLKEFRGKQVGSHILKKVLADVRAANLPGKVYLHAQLPAIPFYEREGFAKKGELFMECDIAHYKMELQR